jgi:outer membrane protein assembly factor BamB
MRLSFLALLFAWPLLAAEPDWPQFRGPKRDGVSTEKGLLKKWSEDGPSLAWKSEGVGEGFSSVAVAGNQVVTMGDSGKECLLFAVSRKDGKKLWEASVGKSGGGGGYPGPRCTPTIDGDLVYGLGQYGDLVCVGLKDGKEKWRTNLKQDFKGSSGGWGYAESVLVDGKNLICTPGGKEATLLALDKKTGKVVWKCAVEQGDPAGYSSIIVSEAARQKQYVTLLANSLVGVSPKDGKLLWRFGDSDSRFGHNTANIPTPIATGNQLIAASGYNRGTALLSLTSREGKILVKEEYWSEKLKNKHGGLIQVGNYLYGDHDDSGRLWCAEAKTGKVQWQRKDDLEAGGSASLVYADGMLYVRYQNGWVTLVEANPKEYKLVSSFKVPNARGNCWAHPVVVGGKLFLREKDTIWCYDVAAK